MQTKKFFAFGLLLSAILFVFNACTKQENEISAASAALSSSIPQMKVENGRIAFKNSDEFFKFSTDVTNKSEEELNAWEKQIGFNSLRKELRQFYSNDKDLTTGLQKLEDFNFPRGHLSILNEKGECLVGDTIVLYLDGLKHFIPNKDEKMLSAIRSNPSVSKIKSIAGGKVSIDAPRNNEITSRWVTAWGGNQIDARYQFPFTSQTYQGSSSVGPKKFVHELVTWQESTGYNPLFSGLVYYHSKLFVRSKLEYKSKNTWKEAGEYRRINYNLSAAYTVSGDGVNTNTQGGNNGHWSISGTKLLVNTGQYELRRLAYELLIYEFNTASFTSTTWNINVTGNIGQIMDGDAQVNYYQNTVNPLW
jgi:hypothetical protein